MADERSLTYGEKAVGLTFNPSGDPAVQKLKGLYAQVIDVLDQMRNQSAVHHAEIDQRTGMGKAVSVPSERGRLCSIAITEAQAAQMWAVKAAVWKD